MSPAKFDHQGPEGYSLSIYRWKQVSPWRVRLLKIAFEIGEDGRVQRP